jgi:HAE1 family hydrophobic/amphiphilic exporter-1
MRTFVGFCLANRSVVILFAALLMAAGAVSLVQMDQELVPSIDLPTVYVDTAQPGAAPAVVDRGISLPLSNALRPLPRVTGVSTQSAQGFSTVAVRFDLDSSLQADVDAVDRRLAQLTLPAGAGRPLVQTFSVTETPAITYSLAATDGDLVRATREANNVIAPAIRRAAGVSQVRVAGGARQQATVSVDATQLAASGLTLDQVVRALRADQVDVGAGELPSGTQTVPLEVRGGFATADEVRNAIVGTVPAAMGRPARTVRLADMATVASGPVPVNGISRTNGTASLSIQVLRQQNANAVALSDAVHARVAGLRLAPGDRLDLLSDDASDIRASLNDLVLEGLAGAALAILVIFLFLGSLRATLVTSVSLPASVLVALLATRAGGYSLNVLTLAGLTIAVGRIVDDAIVVLENSYRHLEAGETPVQAALNGTVGVASAITSSTLTTVAVFLPIGFAGGVISRFFLPFSITVTVSLLASLLVALTVVPVLVSLFGGRRRRPRQRETWLVRAYRPLLRWSLAGRLQKAAVLVLAAALLGGALAGATRLPQNFLAFGGTALLTGTVTLPAGTSTAETSRQLQRFESAVRSDRAVKLAVTTISSTDYGSYVAGFNTNQARLLLVLSSRDGTDQAARRLQRQLDGLYGAGSSQLAVSNHGLPGGVFLATASGADEAALRRASAAMVADLRGDGELANVGSDLEEQRPSTIATLDPAATAQHRVTPAQVASTVAEALTPQPAGALATGGEPVVLQLAPSSLGGGQIQSLAVAPGVTLGQVAAVTTQLAPSTISRQDGTRQVTVTAAILGQDASGAARRATGRLQQLALPAGVALGTGGTSDDIDQNFATMFRAIAVGAGIVFLILVGFFRTVTAPLVITLTMPLALIGAVASLLLLRQPLGLPALLGVLMVFGIVVSNAILLIDFTERSAGPTIRDALMVAGRARLRPIVMTAVATIVALVPVAAGLSRQGGGGLISQSLALVVEGGLVSSTLLTLIVIPIVYSLVRRSPRRHLRVVTPAEHAVE